MSNKSKGVRDRLRAQIPEILKMRFEHNMTWGQIGLKFGRDRSSVCRSVQKFLPVPHFNDIRKTARGLD